jgi:hypothetical protein
LSTLYRINDLYKDINVQDPLVDLDRSKRSTLANEDPVTCCIYFHTLVNTIMAMLQTKNHHNPFSMYRVLDYFLRIEFQHRGSPHSYILLWLENDPKEPVSVEMPQTIRLVETLCTVSQDDVPNPEMYANQVHRTRRNQL